MAIACTETGRLPTETVAGSSHRWETRTVAWSKVGDSAVTLSATAATLTRQSDGRITSGTAEEIVDAVLIARLRSDVQSHLPTIAAATLSRSGVLPTSGTAARNTLSDEASHSVGIWIVRGRTADGKEVRTGFIKGKEQNGLPIAMMTSVGGTLISVTEMEHEHINGHSRLRRIRTTALDAAHRAAIVFDTDLGEKAVAAASLGLIGSLRARGSALLPQIGRLVQPDALYAQTVSEENVGGCTTEAGIASVAAGIAASQLLEVAAARVLLTAAEAALAAACVETLPVCAELSPGLAAAVSAAELVVTAKVAAAGTAIVAAGLAADALWECMRKPKVPSSTGSGGSGGPIDIATREPDCWVEVGWDSAGNVLWVFDMNGCMMG